MKTIVKNFGSINDQNTHLFTIENSKGNFIQISDYGATWVSAVFHNKQGVSYDALLGFDCAADYLNENCYMGSIIGRFAGRIENGCFSLNGESFALSKNHKGVNLHGGFEGFDKKIWKPEIIGSGLKLTYISNDGEEGFPGTLTLIVTYKLFEDDTVSILYDASTTDDTICNFTNHAYFNLAGKRRVSINNHILTIDANYWCENKIDSTLSGKINPVKDSIFDFSTGKELDNCLSSNDPQITQFQGIDHSFVLRKAECVPACTLFYPPNGYRLRIYTSFPDLHVYTGNFLDCHIPSKSSHVYHPYDGICLETQYFMNSNGYSQFPSNVLRKEDHFIEKTTYKFDFMRENKLPEK